MIAASWPQDLSGPIASRFDVLAIGDWFEVKTALAASEAHWSPVWMGEKPPSEELRMLVVENIRPQVLLVAASSARSSKAVERYRDALEGLVRETGVDLMLAGKGAWRHINGTDRVHTLPELQGALS
jgi:hypothetical protein